MTGFTPGPWRAELQCPRSIERHAIIEPKHNLDIAWTKGGDDLMGDKVDKANARLIAEAPAMYALIKRVDDLEKGFDSIGKEARALLERIDK